jgi:ribonuclease P protein component
MDSGQTFQKRERIVSQKLMEQLFDGTSSHSMSVFPLRVVFMTVPRTEGACPVQILVSVPKRRFKHAVDRNRVKRQVREAFRKNKHLLWTSVPDDQQLAIAFIWLANELMPTPRVAHSVTTLLTRINKGLRE